MGHLLRDTDLVNVRSLYPYLRISPLTSQQEKAILLYFRGLTKAQAATEAGYTSHKGVGFLNSPEAVAIMDYLRADELQDIRVSRDSLTGMLLASHAKAATATEEIMAVREIGKMHDLYASDANNKGGNTLIINGNVQNIKQIERMDDSKLLELAGFETLDPVANGETLEGEARILTADVGTEPQSLDHDEAENE